MTKICDEIRCDLWFPFIQKRYYDIKKHKILGINYKCNDLEVMTQDKWYMKKQSWATCYSSWKKFHNAKIIKGEDWLMSNTWLK